MSWDVHCNFTIKKRYSSALSTCNKSIISLLCPIITRTIYARTHTHRHKHRQSRTIIQTIYACWFPNQWFYLIAFKVLIDTCRNAYFVPQDTNLDVNSVMFLSVKRLLEDVLNQKLIFLMTCRQEISAFSNIVWNTP